ncbi:dTMP kinase [Actinomadura kijaniata]|uniref:dTMP kinase n=1 Tax=Actinomadura kijaniata TaxID=46161 RepID=UPI003F1ACE36
MTRTGVTRPRSAEPQPGGEPLRRLRPLLSLSSLGHWLTVPALTAMAATLTRDDALATRAQSVGLVLVAWLLPVLLAPVFGTAAARLDRRIALVAADALRALLMISVPVVDLLVTAVNPVLWTAVVAVLVSCAGMVWSAAAASAVEGVAAGVADDEDGTVGRAVRRRALRLVFGTAPLAALAFVLLALLADALLGGADRVHLVLYATAVVFGATGFATAMLGGLPGGEAELPAPVAALLRREGGVPGLLPAVAGTVLPVAALLAVARVHVRALGGGDPGYGALLLGLTAGLAYGVFAGPRLLAPLSRRRLLGLAVVAGAVALLVAALVTNLVVVVVAAALTGVCAGVAWATAAAVDDAPRPRALALVTALVAVAAAPPLAGVLGDRRVSLGDAAYTFTGSGAALLAAAVLALVAGAVAYRGLDDRRGVPLRPDLAAALRGERYVPPREEPAEEPRARTERGVFIAFEGGEGAGKTTQSRLAAIWLRDHGYEVVTTREPGATKTGMRLRALLLDKETTGLSSRAETLLYAADRADHVANVIRPALERGAIVVSDRYVDSSLAYQGYGREQDVEEIAAVNAWATEGLVPDLTVLLEVPAETGLNRLSEPADRLESEPRAFHDRVLRGFRELAEAHPERYLIVDASRPQQEIRREIQDRIREILPDPVPAAAEDITSTFPAITDV